MNNREKGVMKRITMFLAAVVVALSAVAQGVYTRECNDKALQKKAIK